LLVKSPYKARVINWLQGCRRLTPHNLEIKIKRVSSFLSACFFIIKKELSKEAFCLSNLVPISLISISVLKLCVIILIAVV